MRIERRGNPPNLQTAFKGFVISGLRGRALDDNFDVESAAGRFPDFACLRDMLLIEVKHLETDQSDRVNEVFDELVDPNEKPVFYGSRDGRFVIDAVSNGQEVRAKIASKLARTIEKLLKSANDQFDHYRKRHPRKNSVSICVILNSTLREFTPDAVLHAIYKKTKRPESDRPRFSAIDAVLYISEKHYTKLPDGRVAFPVTIFEHASAVSNCWKKEIVDQVVREWSNWRSRGPVIPQDRFSEFDIVHDIPDQMKRHETWILEYARDPYMSALPVERLKIMFNRCVALNSLTFIKGSWPKPSREETEQQLRFFQHLNEEANRRGLDLRAFSRDRLTAEERAEVYAGLPEELVEILGGNYNKNSSPPHAA